MTADLDAEHRKLGVILFGASDFEHYSDLANPAFLFSARAFQTVLSNPRFSLFDHGVEVLDLFDAPDDPRGLFTKVRDFIRVYPDLSDVLVYYCGHGCFLNDHSYLLLLRGTDPDMAEFTGLQPRFMRNQFERHLAARRLFLVLDCCFAGAAAQEWMSDDAQPLVMQQFRDAFPSRGAVLALAASKHSVAIAPKGETMTMFTGSIVETLTKGLSDADRSLSFRQVINAAREHILHNFGSSGVAPELHSPTQDQGDIADMPFFYNLGYQFRTAPRLRQQIEELLAEFDRGFADYRRTAVRALAEIPVQSVDETLRHAVAAKLTALVETDDSFSVRGLAKTEFARWVGSGEERNQRAVPETEGDVVSYFEVPQENALGAGVSQAPLSETSSSLSQKETAEVYRQTKEASHETKDVPKIIGYMTLVLSLILLCIFGYISFQVHYITNP
jgi:hypothetical protein